MARWTELEIDIPPIETGGGWGLKPDLVSPWAWQDSVFSPDECDQIIEIGERQNLSRGTTFDDRKDNYRDSFVTFLFPSIVTEWVFRRMAATVQMFTDRYFGFDLSGIQEGIQFTRYSAPGEHYHDHVDASFGTAIRKLSVVVQLSDPTDYEGGALELLHLEEPTVMSAKRGTVLAFPSYTLHRVTPVTKGTRYSLVAWITGPAFK